MKEQQAKGRSSPEPPPEKVGGEHPASPRPEDRPAGSDPASGVSRPLSGTEVHAYIGRQLRAVYDDVAKQPVPDRFLELMKQLEAKTADR